MRPYEAKRTRTCSHKIRNDKKYLTGPQLQLTTNQIGTRNGQYDSIDFETIIVIVFYLTI